ncbi:alpha/beta hydrolase [Alteromonas macleodii]|uniref:alpha/beta hydrolase n=1 Tax=Alteromonas macleodii TaxID=28108 RepID=UPI0020769C94|nr:alpha/beta hydrolase [Alteromonas macleodii]USI28549.1 alpha/beta hydrolase [Alteromonas macleodii]
MKILAIPFIVALSLAGCSTIPETSSDLGRGLAQSKNRNINPHPNYLLCRGDDTTELEAVLKSALNAKGILLYFHGGLSGDSYMREDLGPDIMASLFTEKNLNGLHPVFINYEVSPFQSENLLNILKNSAFAKLKSIVKQRLNEESNKNQSNVTKFSENRSAEQSAALSILIYQGLDKGIEFSNSVRSEEDYEVFLTKVLTDEETLKEVAENIIQDSALRASTNQFEILASQQNTEDLQPLLNKGSLTLSGAKAIARTLARFALTLNHEIVPTITEEVLRELSLLGVIGVEDALQTHWRTVKRHSEECWGPKTNGNALINALLEKKKKDSHFTISVMSHSAGSLVIGKLLESISQFDRVNREHAIDNAVLVVPAISAEWFQQTFMRHESIIKKLRVYPLTDEYEKNDFLIPYLYPASLLYGVSGIGEPKGFGDKPLMIQRHLGMKRYPYRTWLYRKVFEDIRDIWAYVESNPEIFKYYPFDESQNEGATHRLTKLPWCSKTLAKQTMSVLTGLSENQIEVVDRKTKCD